MSRYVWRGLDYGASPSIQPNIELGFGNFAIGAWGAYTTSFTTTNILGIQVMDLYASYTIADIITVAVTDYFFPQEADYNYNYFDYGSDTTGDSDFGIVNLGISSSREIAITEKFSLPVSAALITNPEAKQIHLVFGVSLMSQ